MKIYLDACCLNRPFDDQRQDRIRLEAEAVLLVLARVEDGAHELITSEAVELEIAKIPDPNRRERIQEILPLASRSAKVGKWDGERAKELTGVGFGAYDALHLACAEAAGVDVLLTTDDRLVKRASRLASRLTVRVANPAQWLLEGGT